MISTHSNAPFGWRVYGIGILALGLVALVWSDFDSGQPVPKDFPARTLFVYTANIFLIAAGAGIEWRRSARWVALVLAIYYAFVVVIVMNGRILLAHLSEYGTYSGMAEQLAIGAGALIIYAGSANFRTWREERFLWIGQKTFGACAILFGGAHFFYVNLTAPLIPTWLPLSQVFWAYATGICHIAGGIGILFGIKSRLAAILLTIMFVSFTAIVHIPMLIAAPSSHWIWNENALNIALIGVAWVVADSLKFLPVTGHGEIPR